MGLSRNQRDLGVHGVFHLRGDGKKVRPYLGAGMSAVRSSAKIEAVAWGPTAHDWALGADLIGGVDLTRGRHPRLFAEVRGQLWASRQVVASLGLRY